MPSKTLAEYFNRVLRESGLQVPTFFPPSPNDEQQHALDCINATLRELNNHYYLAFKQTSYTLTSAAGTASYDLTQSPYSLEDWEVSRIAGNGVIRVSDDYPLQYLDYKDRDYLQPNRTGNTSATHYSQYGQYLLFYPAPAGEDYTIRYYSTHIGTDTTGATKKWALSESDDLTMLQDRWEDALVYGAATKKRRTIATDDKYMELKKIWEEWRTHLIDMMQAGEDASPELAIPTRKVSYLEQKIGPFFAPYIGG